MSSHSSDHITSLEESAKQASQAGDHAKAETLHREIYELRSKQQGPSDLALIREPYHLASSLIAQQKYADAKPLLEEVVKEMKARPQPADGTKDDTTGLPLSDIFSQQQESAEKMLKEANEGLNRG